MRIRCHRSERGDVSPEPVLLWASATALAIALVTIVVVAMVQHRLLATLGHLAGVLLFVGVVAVGWDWVDRRRAARPVPPLHWVRPPRHEPMTVELASGARVLFDGVDLVADPAAPGPDVDAVLEAWRLARPDRLPPVLAQAARARWASLELGLTAKALDHWLRGIDCVQRGLEDPDGMSADEVLVEFAITSAAAQAAWWSCLDEVPAPEAMGELLEAGVRSLNDASYWRSALGHRPRPQEIRELLAAGWPDGYDASAWATAFGRLPDRRECAPLLSAGVKGSAAAQWAKALAAPPTVEAIQLLQAGGVASSYEAQQWSRVAGTPLTPDLVRPWLDAGVRDANDAGTWALALGRGITPAAISQLRRAGVEDGADASYWRSALGEVPTPERVSELIARGMRSGRDAARRLARESARRP